MNFNGNFRRAGDVNVDDVKAMTDKLTDESWQQDSNDVWAATHGPGVHVIYLVHDDRLRHDQPTHRPALEVFGQLIRPILAVTADFFDSSPEGRQLSEQNGPGYFIRARLLRLSSGSSMAMPAAIAFSETHAHRVHVPIISDSGVSFAVGDEVLCIPEGEIFEVNNRRIAEVDNSGQSACVHLILEYVLKGEACCCSSRRHPSETCSPEACFAFDQAPQACDCMSETSS